MSSSQILVVDDFLPWQHFVRELFETESDLNITHFAVDGLEGVRIAEQLQPDVILMDVNLPVMNGLEAARKIRTFSPHSKVLFLSEHRSPDVIQAAFDIGASGYVLKSDSNSDLIPGVRAVIRGQQFVSHSLKDWRSLDSGDLR
jgi:DNA-binding NarL/FixJ family response regulator